MASLLAHRARPRLGRPGARVTVVIPCFNYAAYLAQAVRSALSQTDVDVDVIVVDDASNDESLVVARALASDDSRVTVLANSVNLGPVDTFNRGLASASGEYLVRLDADDMLTPGSLQRAVAVMQAHPSVGLVYGHPIHFSGSVLPAPRVHPTAWTIWTGQDWVAARAIDGTNSITSPEVLMRRAVVDRVGGQRRLDHTHDMEMWLRIAVYSDVAYVNGVDQAWHREHPASLSTKADDPSVILHEIRAAFDVLFKYVEADLPKSELLAQASRRATALQALAQARRLLDRGIRGPQVDELLEFAGECSVVVGGSRGWLHATNLARPGSATRTMMRLRGIPPRLVRRAIAFVRYKRWEESGVYERVRVIDDHRASQGERLSLLHDREPHS